MRYARCGDAAFTVEIAAAPDAASARRIAYIHATLTRSRPPGFCESVPGLTTLTVLFDPDRVTAAELAEYVSQLAHEQSAALHSSARTWRIPVCYGAGFGPDLNDVAAACSLTPADVAEAHAARAYVVYVIGFSPGFPYLGDIDPRLVLPRRAEPRSRVPAGSVAIATEYTGIYPQATAGGWHVIGRTPMKLFDVARERPALLQTGDVVEFYAIDERTYARYTPDPRADVASRG